MENKVETTVEETVEVQTVLKDNTLNVLPVWTNVFIPYMSVVNDIYEVRECVIESIGDLVENDLITIFYNARTISDTDWADGEVMTLNILANISTSYDDANKELNDFLSKQINALAEHSTAMKEQLIKNDEHIKLFTDKVK